MSNYHKHNYLLHRPVPVMHWLCTGIIERRRYRYVSDIHNIYSFRYIFLRQGEYIWSRDSFPVLRQICHDCLRGLVNNRVVGTQYRYTLTAPASGLYTYITFSTHALCYSHALHMHYVTHTLYTCIMLLTRSTHALCYSHILYVTHTLYTYITLLTHSTHTLCYSHTLHIHFVTHTLYTYISLLTHSTHTLLTHLIWIPHKVPSVSLSKIQIKCIITYLWYK